MIPKQFLNLLLTWIKKIDKKLLKLVYLGKGGECVLDIDQEDGFTCCDPPANSKTEYENREGVCVEVNRCEDNTHFCMSDGYGGLCTWTTNVGYKCGCRPGYAGKVNLHFSTVGDH